MGESWCDFVHRSLIALKPGPISHQTEAGKMGEREDANATEILDGSEHLLNCSSCGSVYQRSSKQRDSGGPERGSWAAKAL